LGENTVNAETVPYIIEDETPEQALVEDDSLEQDIHNIDANVSITFDFMEYSSVLTFKTKKHTKQTKQIHRKSINLSTPVLNF